MRKNEYRIKDNVNKELLKEIGFTEYVPNHLYYRIHFYGTLTLNIIIPFIDNKVDLDNLKIRVSDRESLQPYFPFYQGNGYPNIEFLEGAILKYNQEMDELVKKGIFEKVESFSFIEKYYYLIDETRKPITLPNIDEGDIPRLFSLEELANKEDDSKRLRLIRENRRK